MILIAAKKDTAYDDDKHSYQDYDTPTCQDANDNISGRHHFIHNLKYLNLKYL